MQEKTEWFLCISTILVVFTCVSMCTRLRETTTLTGNIWEHGGKLYYFIHLTEIKTFSISVAVYGSMRAVYVRYSNGRFSFHIYI